MKVEINGHLLTIGWNYESRIFDKKCHKLGFTKEDFKGLNKQEIAVKLGLKAFPLPETTHCIITDTVTGDKYTGTVKRYINKDLWDREEARKRSLTKAIWTLFPEKENKEQSLQRQKFWNAYHNRRLYDPQRTIKKLIKENVFSLSDLQEYVKSNQVLKLVH